MTKEREEKEERERERGEGGGRGEIGKEGSGGGGRGRNAMITPQMANSPLRLCSTDICDRRERKKDVEGE